MATAQRWRNETNRRDGTSYVRNKCFLFSMMQDAYVPDHRADRNSTLQHRFSVMKLPDPCSVEEDDPRLAWRIV